MLKFLTYFSLSLLLLVWLSQNKGFIDIDWLGYQIEIQLIFLIPALIIVKIILLKLFFLFTRARKNKLITKQTDAIEKVIQGLSYTKIGDLLSSNSCLKQAKKNLKSQAIVKLLEANNKLLEGKNESAKKLLREIIKNCDTLSVTALNQLLKVAYSEKNLLEIETIIEQTKLFFPKEPWSLLKQGEFFCYTRQYDKAIKILEKIKKHKLQPGYDLKERISILNYAVAKESYLRQDYNKALNYLARAEKFVGSVMLNARILCNLNKQNKAKALLEKEYKRNPHKDIFNLYTELGGDKINNVIDNEKKCWECSACYKKPEEWDYICRKCDELGTIRWL
ncbi:MAG: hypothetical protein HRK26_00495 [Rickettsiaceae bacterium H1]|nr:hypothetical protein [Rickettsiaceae bacterium H1]